MSVISEQVGRGEWEAARFRGEYEGIAYSRFLCRVVVKGKTLTGIIDVQKREEKSRGTLLIPTEVTHTSPLADAVKENVAQFRSPSFFYEDEITKELGLVFNRHYADLQVSSLAGGRPDRLGVYSSLTVSNRFSQSAPRALEAGDTGTAMGLAQHIMDSLPGWQITPEPVISW